MIQLGMADCFQKLSDDLAYLFVFHPTATFSMSVTELESCYAECYGRKLEPAIYAAKTVQKLFTWKQVVKVMQVWFSNHISILMYVYISIIIFMSLSLLYMYIHVHVIVRYWFCMFIKIMAKLRVELQNQHLTILVAVTTDPLTYMYMYYDPLSPLTIP